MYDNGPLLFINSVQSKIVKNSNQYIYDSRIHQNVKIPEIKKEEVTEPPQVIEVKEEQVKPKEVPEMITNDDENKLRKLQNKLELLNKRARLGRYVLVKVIYQDSEIEGYFRSLQEDVIIIANQEQELEISIKDIKNIEILKV